MAMKVRRFIINFRFVDDDVVNTEEQEEADFPVDCLDTSTTRYKMEIGPGKTKQPNWRPKRYQDKRWEA